MSKEIVISVTGDQSRIAIVEDGELVELYVENPDNVRTIGDIYLSRVRRILPGIKAAFVDIGQKQDAFLHFSDLSDNVPALLELAEGQIKEHASDNLPKSPSGDPDTLELESAEEQIAAKRRKELKRTPETKGGRRRPRAAEPEAAEEAEATAESAPAAEKPSRRGTSRRKTEAARREDVPVAPAILPPDAELAEEAAVAEPAPAGDAAQPERQGGSRRRGRRRKKPSTDQAPTEQPAAATPAGGGAQEAGAEADVQSDEAPAREKRPSRSRRKRPQDEEAKPVADAQKEASASSRPSRAKKESEETAPPAAEASSDSASSPRLAPSSRFVIDLTARPGKKASGTASPRREEEEEEEESSNGRRSRRSSRSGGGRGRRSGGRGSKTADESVAEADAGSDSDSGDDSGESRSGDGRSGNGRSSNGKPPYTYLKQDQRIIVKISKEPISSKGSRVSTDVSLAGRFLVLIPAADYVAVSKKIESSKERRRLRALARSLLPEGYGLIVRTVAEGRDAKALDADLKRLVDKWREAEEILKKRPEPPVRLYEDVNMVSSIIRDLFSEDYDRIIVDDPTIYRNIKTYVEAVAPQMASAVQLHQRKEPVFRTYKLEADVRAAFESRVSLPGGGYLFVETTEAMHVVDVNSGRAGRGMSQEENALKVNLEAAAEIAKQLRLRDLGGIICVDFIDMRSDAYRKKVYDELSRAFRKDRAVTKLLPMSDFGVIEITRQRLRPSITTTLDVEEMDTPIEDREETPKERPTGSTVARSYADAPSASEIVAHLERWLGTYRDEVSDKHKKRPILIRVHPFLAAYLQRGIPSLLTRWRFRTRLKLVLDVDESADPLAFSVKDQKSGKNLTKKYDPDRR